MSDQAVSPQATAPSEAVPLPPDRLYRAADLAALSFATTAELTPLPGLIDQPRAREAINLGTCISRPGFNIFAIGSSFSRIQQAVKEVLNQAAFDRPAPADWVYVNNFAEPHHPVAISLPAGRAPMLHKAIHELIEDLKATLPALFESEDYQKRRSALEQSIQSKGQKAFESLNEKATARGIAILRTPMGFAMAPARDGKVVPPAEFNTWPEAEQKATRDAIEELEKDLEDTLRAMPRLEKEVRDAVRALERETAAFDLGHPIGELKQAFADLPKVLAHIDAIAADLLENVQMFTAQEGPNEPPMLASMRMGGMLERYEVNVLVTQADHGTGAPVIEELHPTLANLIGRIEYLQMQGALVTNFRLIKAGALHRANGGTILLDARSLLMEPFSWPALKRALSRQEITIEDAGRFLGMTTTVSLEPDPIPLDVKVVLYGDRTLYYMLAQLDPDMATYFKVLADFDDDLDRSPDNEAMLARIIAGIVARESLLPLDRDAVARVLEQAARLADDSGKLTLQVEHMRDLVTEADHFARQAARSVITRADIVGAIEAHIRRHSRIRERGAEMILRDVALVDTAGSAVGQINGLSVMSLAGYGFGRPSRITCRVRPGGGKIVDIEREVELGGPLHSKGVLILSGFLAGRYALDAPMSVYASLVFEQSYGGVDGDSASSAELYALLSALAEAPLRQDIAVTGSVNQHGQVQAIGGVNEKIEGFFDICAGRGLTGTQGVMIPAANVRHLMLRADVVEACATGRFSIWPISSIDQGIALLTGRPAGARGADGPYPEGSINRAVEDRLRHFAELRKQADGKAGIT
ncbi:MAG: Lon protease family protein [Acetobacteraceae bacterium]